MCIHDARGANSLSEGILAAKNTRKTSGSGAARRANRRRYFRLFAYTAKTAVRVAGKYTRFPRAEYGAKSRINILSSVCARARARGII